MNLKYMCQERGSVVLLSMLILAALSMLGVASLTTSGIETRVAANYKDAEVVFYGSDTPQDLVSRLIGMTLQEKRTLETSDPNDMNIARPFRYLNTATDDMQDPLDDIAQATFYHKIAGFVETNPENLTGDPVQEALNDESELTYSLGNGLNTFVLSKARQANQDDNIEVNIFLTFSSGQDEALEVVEFGSAADGVGFMAPGGGAGGSGQSNYYLISSVGTSVMNSRANIIARYRQILGQE